MSRGVYFFSDVHFQGQGSLGDTHFLSCLESLKTKASAIYFVGDLLDFWIGHAEEHEPYQALWATFRRLIASGVRLHCFTGNHDPAPLLKLEHIGVEIYTEGQAIDFDQRRIWIEHGDLLDPSSLLRRLICKIARLPAFLSVARMLPSRMVWSAAHRYTSRPHTYDRPLHTQLRTTWFESKINAGCQDVIIGHYHRAVNYQIHGPAGPHQFIALGDWLSQMTYARLDNQLTLLRYRSPDMGSKVVPAGDHCPPLNVHD